jgi:hypothetical protein
MSHYSIYSAIDKIILLLFCQCEPGKFIPTSEPIVLIESKFCQRASERLCSGSLAHLTASSGVEDMVNIFTVWTLNYFETTVFPKKSS